MKRTETTLPNIEYVTASGRFDSNRKPVDLIVLHSTAGTLQSAINLFSNAPAPGKETSAHYIIDNQGKIHQGLEEFLVAFHCGDYAKNQRSIGIEHVDEGKDVKLHTDAQYEMSYKLVADICKFYNIPCDSTHIVPHSSIVATACPNGLDVNRIIDGAKNLLNTTDPCKELEEKIIKLEEDLKGVRKSRDDWKRQHGDLSDKYTLELGEKIKTIEAQQKQISNLNESLTLATKDKDVLLQEKNLLKGNVEALEGKLKATELDVSSVKKQLDNQYLSIVELNDEITALKQKNKSILKNASFIDFLRSKL